MRFQQQCAPFGVRTHSRPMDAGESVGETGTARLLGERRRPSSPAMRSRMASIVCQYSSISDTPRFERLTVVRIFLSTISLVIITSPASSRFVSCTDRFPLVSPVTRCRNTKSADRQEDSTVRIARRAGSCTNRLGTGTVLRSSFTVILLEFLRHQTDQREVTV